MKRLLVLALLAFAVILLGWIAYGIFNVVGGRKEVGSELELAPNEPDRLPEPLQAVPHRRFCDAMECHAIEDSTHGVHGGTVRAEELEPGRRIVERGDDQLRVLAGRLLFGSADGWSETWQK